MYSEEYRSIVPICHYGCIWYGITLMEEFAKEYNIGYCIWRHEKETYIRHSVTIQYEPDEYAILCLNIRIIDGEQDVYAKTYISNTLKNDLLYNAKICKEKKGRMPTDRELYVMKKYFSLEYPYYNYHYHDRKSGYDENDIYCRINKLPFG